MNYAGAIRFLYDLRLFGAKFGLENTLHLASLAGNPHRRLRFIHVAGTNGKGSTCAMLESIYRAAGLRTGLFTSPHLVSFRERIQINRQLISEAEVVRLVGQLSALLNNQAGLNATFFEFVTVMALKFFASQRCDLVLWETGLGGRLDATNIVTPLAAVITNVALDHQQWLGDRLEQIAFEKAGIIKNGVPVVTSVDDPKALPVIENIAREKGAPLVNVATRAATPALPIPLSLAGAHQRVNAALAMAVVGQLQGRIPVSHERILAGFSGVQWPGRLQLVERNGRKILLDGAHNVAAAKTLVQAIRQTFPHTPRALILGILQDKDWKTICRLFAPLAREIRVVPVASPRSANPRDLAAACRAANPAAATTTHRSLPEAFRAAFARAATGGAIVVTGSLYLVGEALECLGIAPAAGERDLNEWTASPPVVH
ncbi:MAG: bifunctional folylpolyglutamate synthase/dihydrofolate synthase [Verrucomicrobia bacterium]|nr:bifunctional folylpolyglutamate synthase/dihydrofolate synthase [Verrucomicrobiota bacterium]MDE3099427.1 bifunctional folylpolyglutamate synthase/dihydrofolate synthase [Verrucomicrobiota bacterium]